MKGARPEDNEPMARIVERNIEASIDPELAELSQDVAPEKVLETMEKQKKQFQKTNQT